MPATFFVGDAIEVMGKLPENSVDLILTSPPFLALRSYLPADHPDKAKEGGSQSTPGEFIDWLLDVAEACNRVLAPHGSLCIELGDTYSGGAVGWTEEDRNPGFGRSMEMQQGGAVKTGSTWPLPKSLSLIPETFRFAMVYGFNPHTGRTTEPWRLRNVIRWVRPNPPVGALGDKFRPATSELMVFCKSAKRYFDLDAVREPYKPGQSGAATKVHYDFRDGGGRGRIDSTGKNYLDGPGAPPLDWWNIPLLEGEEETRYGPKEPKPKPNFRAANPALLKSLTKGNTTRLGEPMVNNPLGTPPLDWWNIPPGGSSQPRPVNPGEFAGGTLYIRSAGCPVHEDRSAPVATALHGEPAETSSNRSSDTDGRPAPMRPAGSVPTVQPTLLNPEDGSSDSTDLPSTPAATPRSKASNRTDPSPGSTSPGTSSGRTRRRIDDIPNGPLSAEPHPDTPENRTSAVRLAAPALESYARTGHKPPELESCTCTFYTPESSHYAVFPEGVPLDWWEIPPGGFSGAHYAVFPPELCVKPVKAMSPERVCKTCGEPSRREVERERLGPQLNTAGRNGRMVQELSAPILAESWSDCGHDDWRPGLVLDPFAGSGTTLAVATGHGRDAIGIDLDSRNFDLALERVGPFILTRGEIDEDG